MADLCARANALPDPPAGARGRLIPFASLNPFIVNDLALELKHLVQELGFRGLKAYPVYQFHYMNDPQNPRRILGVQLRSPNLPMKERQYAPPRPRSRYYRRQPAARPP